MYLSHWKVLWVLLLSIAFSSNCCPTKAINEASNGDAKEYIYIIELAKGLDGIFLKEQLKKEKPFNINRTSRSKNVWTFTIVQTQAQSQSILDYLNKNKNVLSVSIEDLTLHNTEGKTQVVKKVKPIIK
jgi:hypothetical protein